MRLSRLLPGLAFVAAACGGGGDGGGNGGSGPPTGPTPPPPGTVVMGAVSFNPSSIETPVGGTITWNNTSGIEHNVTFAATQGAPSDIGNHASGSNQRTFNSAGTFSYQCTIHAIQGMTGQVVVQ